MVGLHVATTGCTVVSKAHALVRSTSEFVPSSADPRVMYEPGAESLAATVAASLPESIKAVEASQYRPFVLPVSVYVCATVDSFAAHTANRSAGGHVIGRRLFISPKHENTAERVPRILTHELSHLQIDQQVSLLTVAELPVWFAEGLGVFVSDGGGAESISEDQARASILAGRTFVPETSGGVFWRKSASSYGLSPHLFYREAAMFVAYLKRLDEARFKTLLLGVEDGGSFKSVFAVAYGEDIDSVWQGFTAELREGTTTEHRR